MLWSAAPDGATKTPLHRVTDATSSPWTMSRRGVRDSQVVKAVLVP
jgi:hypothetical protein